MNTDQLSYNTFLAGFALTGLASLWYVTLALWPRVVYRAAATDAGSTMTIAARGQAPAWFGPMASATTWLTVLALTASLAARWAAAGRPPYANMWEFTVGFGWGILLFHSIFELRVPPSERWASDRTVGAILLPVVLTMFAFALAFFSANLHPLVPALQANRILGAHVATMMMAYAALSVSFGAAAAYLVQGSGRRFARLPSADTLEDIANRSVLVGFPMLTLGITLGAYWGYSAWGRYWGWDPKETSALIVWLIYASYLHARNLRGWKGTGAAWMLVAGFAAVLFTYFAVNLWIAGLHSYAGV